MRQTLIRPEVHIRPAHLLEYLRCLCTPFILDQRVYVPMAHENWRVFIALLFRNVIGDLVLE